MFKTNVMNFISAAVSCTIFSLVVVMFGCQPVHERIIGVMILILLKDVRLVLSTHLN